MSKVLATRIMNRIADFPKEFTKKDIAKLLKASFLDVSNACIKLEKDGKLERVGFVQNTGKRGRKPVIYSLKAD